MKTLGPDMQGNSSSGVMPFEAAPWDHQLSSCCGSCSTVPTQLTVTCYYEP